MSAQLSLKKKIIFSGILISLFLVIIAFLFVAAASLSLFRYAKGEGRFADADRPSDRYFQYDAKLGSSLILGKLTEITRANGIAYSIRTDSEGLREASDPEHEIDGPRVLVLGCSFSFAAGCEGEESYGYLVGKGIGGSTINAAVPGHGLGQMLLKGRELIPHYQPDVVLIQYSYWLVDRSTNLVIPSMFGKVAGPYFVKAADGFTIAPPAFQSSVYDVPIRKFGKNASGILQFPKFLFQVGLPVYAFDGANYGATKFRVATHLIPQPSPEKKNIETFAYQEFRRLSEESGAAAYLVGLGSSTKPVPSMDHLGFPEPMIIDANQYLNNQLATQDQDSYAKAYYHWAQDPDRIIDTHPNPRAHAAIAEAVINRLKASNGIFP